MTTYARAAGSPTAHQVTNRTSPTTLCGKPARLMAKWTPSEAGVDARTWKPCQKCHTQPRRCTCGALEPEGCFCGITTTEFYSTPKAARA
jgi:hypothetical protein